MKKKVLGIMLLVAGFGLAAQAASDSWSLDGSGNWSNTANWAGGNIPGLYNGTSSGDSATFGTALTAPATVTVDNPRAISNINFTASGTNGYTISGGTIRMNNNAGLYQTGTGSGTVKDSIASAIQLRGLGNSQFTFRNNSANRGLAIDGDINNAISAGRVFTITLDGTYSGVNAAINGNIADSANGDVAVVKTGTGQWALTGDNAFAGGLTVSNGTLRYFGNNRHNFGVGTVTIYDGVTFSKANSSAPIINNAMSVLGNFSHNGNSVGNNWSGAMDLNGGTRTITVGGDLTLSGVISNGALTKAGTKTLTLTGANAYTGATTVSAGNLAVEGSLASDVTVQNGATLSGTGTLQKVTLDAGASLSAGNSPGTMTFNGDVLLSEGSTNIMEITDVAYDILMGAGTNTLTMSGVTVFDFTGFTGGVTNGYTLAWSELFQNWAATNITGTASYSYLGLGVGQSLTITNDGFTVIPEPATIGMLGLGALVTLLIRRMRTR